MSIQFNPMWFILIFNLVGGVADGYFFRGVIRRRFACNSFFLFVWGTVFGGLPLFAGIAEFETNPFLLATQIFVFAVSIIVVALAPDILVETLAAPPLRDTILGGICVAIGIMTLIMTLVDATDLPAKILFSGVFIIVGGYLIFDGAKKLIHHE